MNRAAWIGLADTFLLLDSSSASGLCFRGPSHAVYRRWSEKTDSFSTELSVVPRRVMLLWRAISVRRIRRRCSVVNLLVRAFLVEVAQVVGNALLGLGHHLLCMPVDCFPLEAVPEALHVHVARPALHADSLKNLNIICLRRKPRQAGMLEYGCTNLSGDLD